MSSRLALGRYFTSLFLFLVLVLYGPFGCSSDDAAPQPETGAAPLQLPIVEPGITVALDVVASQGGQLTTPDGAILTIPPGALARDTRIEVTVPSAQDGDSEIHTYSLKPRGLVFQAPVQFTIPYADLEDGSDPEIQLIQSSTLNPTTDAGSELVNWTTPRVLSRDTNANTLTMELDHFTFIYGVGYKVDEYAYLVFDIPHFFLQPGDILATLTDEFVDEQPQGRPTWNSGHIGLYQGPINARVPTAGGLVIESSKGGLGDKSSASGVGGVASGRGFDDFRVSFGHLYLGARRPGGARLTAEESQRVVDYARAQSGRAYSLIGAGNITEFGGFSCVGLAEAAYDLIGRGTLTDFEEATASTPLEMFRATVAVNEITVDVGQEIDIPIYSAIVHPNSPTLFTTFRGYYTRERFFSQVPNGVYYDITADNLALRGFTGATFTEDGSQGYRFRWTPDATHAGRRFSVPILLDARPRGILPNDDTHTLGRVRKSRDLIINVRPLPGEPMPSPTPSETPTSTPSPTTSPTPDPVNNINVGVSSISDSHTAGVTNCPQELAEIPLGNPTDRTVTVTISAQPPLFVDSPSFQLAPNTGFASPAVFFDCSTTTSFASSITITATSALGTETVMVPVSLNITVP